MSQQLSEDRLHYLNVKYGIRSRVFTTDHKRIASFYLISVTVFFFIGGFFATLIRLELLTPQGDLVQSETYNKLLTMYGGRRYFSF
jgi:cytochrome c oxidase subunit 1